MWLSPNERYFKMDYSQKLAMSYYKNIATLNETHKIFLVQHQETHKIFVKKILTVYNKDIYQTLSTHPICGIPRIVDYYESDQQLTVIEHYISGQTLEEIIHTNRLTLSTILRYVLELCDILGELHEMHPPIIHRDIKPSNIIITEYDHVVLIDFNAAKYFSASSTSDTVLLGTKGYAAPEQYGFGASSPQTDIYAVGILLKELTSSLTNVPFSLEEIIEKCVQINPADRYRSVAELANALKRILPFPQPRKTATPNYHKFLFPGFRTHTAWKMLIAIPTYFFIFWLSLSLEVENTYGVALWVERIFCLSIFLSVIFGTFNYGNIHKRFPLCNSNYRIVKYFGIALLDFMLAATLFLLMMIVTSIFFA